MQPIESYGGSTVVLLSDKPDVVSSSLARLYEPLRNVYRLEVELDSPVDKPRNWKLETIGSDGKKLKDVEVAYPRLLVPLSDKK